MKKFQILIMPADKNSPKSRKKKIFSEMYPVKVWLDTAEAAAYINKSVNTFTEIAIEHHLTISVIRKTKYFKVSEINEMLDKSIIIRQV